MRAHSRKALSLVNLLLGALLVYLVAGPDGLLGAKVAAWNGARVERERIRRAWPALLDGAHILGNPEASTALVVFSDYECPYCRDLNTTLASLLSELPEINVVWRHYPLRSHPFAEMAALAAGCAARELPFHVMHHALFRGQPWREEPDWGGLAIAAGVSDTAAFMSCLVDPGVGEVLSRDVGLAEDLDVRVTPTLLFRHGQRRDGTMSAADLREQLGSAVRVAQ